MSRQKWPKRGLFGVKKCDVSHFLGVAAHVEAILEKSTSLVVDLFILNKSTTRELHLLKNASTCAKGTKIVETAYKMETKNPKVPAIGATTNVAHF